MEELKPGGTTVTAFWLHIPQGECAQKTRRAVWGPDARLKVEPQPEHSDEGYIREISFQEPAGQGRI